MSWSGEAEGGWDEVTWGEGKEGWDEVVWGRRRRMG